MSWTLANAQRRADKYSSFVIPDKQVRHGLGPGDLAKLLFEVPVSDVPREGRFAGMGGERMWVLIVRREADRYVGEMSSKPFFVKGLDVCDEVTFGPEHVIDVSRIGCVECGMPAPKFDHERQLDEKGWGSRPHEQEPRVAMRICPACNN